jgi:hypothetical protein
VKVSLQSMVGRCFTCFVVYRKQFLAGVGAAKERDDLMVDDFVETIFDLCVCTKSDSRGGGRVFALTWVLIRISRKLTTGQNSCRTDCINTSAAL